MNYQCAVDLLGHSGRNPSKMREVMAWYGS